MMPENRTPKAPATNASVRTLPGAMPGRSWRAKRYRQSRAGTPMMRILAPRTVMPPNPKKTTCKSRATVSAGHAASRAESPEDRPREDVRWTVRSAHESAMPRKTRRITPPPAGCFRGPSARARTPHPPPPASKSPPGLEPKEHRLLCAFQGRFGPLIHTVSVFVIHRIPDGARPFSYPRPREGHNCFPVEAAASELNLTPLTALSLWASSSTRFGLPRTTTISRQLSWSR